MSSSRCGGLGDDLAVLEAMCVAVSVVCILRSVADRAAAVDSARVMRGGIPHIAEFAPGSLRDSPK